MENSRAKKTLKFAVMIYLISFLVINWLDVSWIFNYKEVSGLLSDFFNPYPSINASEITNAYFYPNHSQNNAIITTTEKSIKTAETTYTEKQNTLEVPKIGISVPIIFSKSAEKDSITKDLDLGVVYYPGSVYPGQSGHIVILGHSAPLGWPKIKHDWVFSDIDKLAEGDSILIDLNNKQYKYIVKQKTIIKRGAEIPQDNLSIDSNVLTLISCWPPGKDYQRITVQAELQKI